MKTTYCDMCPAIIKKGDIKYLIAIREVVQGEDMMEVQDVAEYLQKYNQTLQNIQVLELCKECREIIKHVLKMRKQEREKIMKEMEAMYNVKPKIESDKEGNK